MSDRYKNPIYEWQKGRKEYVKYIIDSLIKRLEILKTVDIKDGEFSLIIEIVNGELLAKIEILLWELSRPRLVLSMRGEWTFKRRMVNPNTGKLEEVLPEELNLEELLDG